MSTSQSSDFWNKSNFISSEMKNWGLLRCVEGVQRTNWGSGSGGVADQSGTITLSQLGEHVDVIIVDDNGIVFNHPEYAVNSDGTGGSRAIQYNWYQHNTVVGAPNGNTPYQYDEETHSTHVAGTVAGNTQGWARKANIYNIYYLAGDDTNFNFPYVIDFVREFHANKPVNPITGRKNPTICNNSWGMSIFPNQWSFNDITAVTYRGTRYTPSLRDTGYSGVCDLFYRYAELLGVQNFGNRIITGGDWPNYVATVTEIPNSLLGAASLTESTTPDEFSPDNSIGNNDEAHWILTLPFDITFFGETYNTIYVNTNFWIGFGSDWFGYQNIGESFPPVPKIMFSAGDKSIQRIYYGTEGTAPNRTFRIRLEGHTYYLFGELGNPTQVGEYVFYENTPNQIDLQCGINGSFQPRFTDEQLNGYGFIAGQRIPVRVAALDADLEQAIEDGIIFVGAAGNGRWKHDVPGGVDWDNTFEMANRYPASVSQPYYYMRGTSPTANDIKSGMQGFNIPNICVGAVDINKIDQKVSFSDCGPGVDLYAPGTYIISSAPTSSGFGSSPDPRDSNFELIKLSGTSMASPQVCGVLACALEVYPNMKQEEAKAYILGYAKANQLLVSNGGPTDGADLQGSPNLFLFYPKERPVTKDVFPKKNYKQRPNSGRVYPRLRIRRK
jgi:hypothetical protein